MINAAETQPPYRQTGRVINTGATLPPERAGQERQGIVLQAGEAIAESYVIHSLLDRQGNQSKVYLAKKWGESYAIKIYHNGWRLSRRIESFLTNVHHPNIAPVVACGDYSGYYYEIYQYYPEGTLEDTEKLTSRHIQEVIVPSINEGLHELHRNGIIHCDIKPGNLFYSDKKGKIVIGDCGVSSFTNANDISVGDFRGTPEYAPLGRALLGKTVMSPAYDYGSFGLVLYRVYFGRSLFEGMSIEEISKAWEKGLELPNRINGHIGSLIKGLLNEDENQRWGYEEVKKWCAAEYIQSDRRLPGFRHKKRDITMIFGRFEGQMISVSSLHQLAQAIREHWSHAAGNIIRRKDLIDFVYQFDRTLPDKIRALSLYHDADAAVYKLLMYLEDAQDEIFYCGKEYGSLQEYVEQLSTGKDEIAKRFLSSGLLVFYLRQNGYDRSQVDKLEQFISRNGCDDMTYVSTLCSALQGKRSIELFGNMVETLDDLIPVLDGCSIKQIGELLDNSRFIVWMNRLGFENEMRRMKEV